MNLNNLVKNSKKCYVNYKNRIFELNAIVSNFFF